VTDSPSSQSEHQPVEPTPAEPDPGVSGRPLETQFPPAAVAVPPSRGRTVTVVNVALAIAVAVAIGGIGFAAGRMTAPSSTALGGGNGAGRFFGNGSGNVPSDGSFGGAPRDTTGRGGLFGGGASIQGTVESISGDTLTLRLASGQTIQVSLGGSTTYHSEAAASSSDVTAGKTVIVRIQLDRGQGTVAPSASDVTIVP
jgi:hypothetical protein